MRKKNLLGIFLVVIILSFIGVLVYFIVNSKSIRLGAKKAEIAKILEYKCGNFSEGGVKFEFDKPKGRVVEIFYCSRYRTDYNLEELKKIEPQKREDVFKKILILCFENDSLSVWGYGRIAFMDIMKKYPEIYEVLKSRNPLGMENPSPIPKFKLKLNQ